MAKESKLWADKTAYHQFIAHNERGAELKMGMGEGEFTPGELLKIALAGCQAMSAEYELVKQLKVDKDAVKMTVYVDGDATADHYRFTKLAVDIDIDPDTVSEDVKSKVEINALAGVEKYCTVGHSLTEGTPYTVKINLEK